MFIDKVKIHNFKCYRDFEIIFDEGLNIVVGDNEAGKSTILEAINLALTGIIRGKSIWNEISQYIFNKDAVEEYIISLSTVPIALPYISIEIYFGGNENPLMNGDGNSDRNSSAEGFCFKIAFNEKYADEYEALLSQGNIKSLPIEYYDIIWTTFARDVITTRSIPYKSCLIDSSEYRYQSGSDVYLSRIIKGTLEIEDITSIAQAHRKMRDSFINYPSIEAINTKINQDTSLTDKKIALSVELGKGEQCVIKTELALAKRTSKNASIILLEEPENHLSHTRLNQLIKCISKQYAEKQILISTHSSFVVNKLGLSKVMLLDNLRITKFSELSEDTYNFFKKIAGSIYAS